MTWHFFDYWGNDPALQVITDRSDTVETSSSAGGWKISPEGDLLRVIKG